VRYHGQRSAIKGDISSQWEGSAQTMTSYRMETLAQLTDDPHAKLGDNPFKRDFCAHR